MSARQPGVRLNPSIGEMPLSGGVGSSRALLACLKYLEIQSKKEGMVHKYGDTLLPGVFLAVEFQGRSLEKTSFDVSLVPESGRQVLIPS
jgi:hypothetical protein